MEGEFVAVGVPEDLQAICLACLAWDPADRPTAYVITTELGRFLVGEPVRLKPKLYDDLLRRSISEYSGQARAWASQSIISRDERDALEVVHRRLLADEDHWIVDARRITPLQTILSGATWLAVVATVLMVWMLRDDLAPPWRWLLPAFFTTMLLLAGQAARREREPLAAATFLGSILLACLLAPAAAQAHDDRAQRVLLVEGVVEDDQAGEDETARGRWRGACAGHERWEDHENEASGEKPSAMLVDRSTP